RWLMMKRALQTIARVNAICRPMRISATLLRIRAEMMGRISIAKSSGLRLWFGAGGANREACCERKHVARLRRARARENRTGMFDLSHGHCVFNCAAGAIWQARQVGYRPAKTAAAIASRIVVAIIDQSRRATWL